MPCEVTRWTAADSAISSLHIIEAIFSTNREQLIYLVDLSLKFLLDGSFAKETARKRVWRLRWIERNSASKMQGCRFIGPVLVVAAILQMAFIQRALQFSDFFVNEPFHYLNVDKVRSSQVESAFECAHACLGEELCLSFNLAAFRHDDAFECELLASDKYNAPEQLEPTQEFHHFSIMVSVSIRQSKPTVIHTPPQFVLVGYLGECWVPSAGYLTLIGSQRPRGTSGDYIYLKVVK